MFTVSNLAVSLPMSILWPARDTPGFSYISDAPGRDFIDLPLRRVVVLGSTGSIGKNALDIIARSSRLRPIGLAAGKNIQLLAQQALRWRPSCLAVLTREYAEDLEKKLPGDYKPAILWGDEGYATLAALETADCVLSAQAGSSGLTGTLAAALAGKPIALANKESLVVAGDLLRKICRRTGASILPVDSEHYAIFQCLAGSPGKEIAGLVLTASGGPFFGKTMADLEKVGPREALAHPNWKMGAKISIDSATLMNKGLEYIEASRMFGISPSRISILVHPQSIVHSLVRFADASLLAQLGCPDMRLPIADCLHWPHRTEAFIPELDLALVSPLTFEQPDRDTFACLDHAITAACWQPPEAWLDTGINPACMVLNAANELAVGRFLNGVGNFADIARTVGAALAKVMQNCPAPPSLPQIANPVDSALKISHALAAWVDEKFLRQID